MTLLPTDDGCRGCANSDLVAGIRMRGAKSRGAGCRAAASISGSGRVAGRACTAPYPRVRGRAAAPAARPRPCAGSVNAATADPDGITVRSSAGRLDQRNRPSRGLGGLPFPKKYGCRSLRRREVALVSAKPREDERTLAADAVCQVLRNLLSVPPGTLFVLSHFSTLPTLVGERT
jgi:hypothetical protein